jgi:hypothetical protein
VAFLPRQGYDAVVGCGATEVARMVRHRPLGERKGSSIGIGRTRGLGGSDGPSGRKTPAETSNGVQRARPLARVRSGGRPSGWLRAFMAAK